MELDFKLMGQRIRQARKISGLTISELAAQVSLTRESLRHIETGVSKPRLQTLFQISSILHVSMDYLTGRAPALSEALILDHRLSAVQRKAVQQIVECTVCALLQEA